MSLTGQLTVGDLGRWCAANLTGTARLVADVAVAAAAAATEPIRPLRMDDPSTHWSTIGGALGQRLAFATQHAPPYYALLGAHSAGLADWSTVQRAAAAFPTHTQLDPARALRPLSCGRCPTAAGSTSTASPPPTSPAGSPPALAPGYCLTSPSAWRGSSPSTRRAARHPRTTVTENG